MNKKRIIQVLLSAIIICFIAFLVLDWLRFFYPTGITRYLKSLLSKHLKLVTTFFNLLIVWLASEDSFSPDDIQKLRLLFICILTGDVLLVYRFNIPGIIIFGLVQMLLIWRNGVGLRQFITTERWKQHLRWVVACTGLTVMATVLLNTHILKPLLTTSQLYPVVVIYSIIFGVSLWTAWMSIPVGSFERANAYMIAAGMTFFYACDINVGICLSPERGAFKMVCGNLIWLFYTPALTLLGLSGYAVKTFFFNNECPGYNRLSAEEGE